MLLGFRPRHSFATRLNSAGVEWAERVSKVRWSVAEDIVTSWPITIPASGPLAAGSVG